MTTTKFNTIKTRQFLLRKKLNTLIGQEVRIYFGDTQTGHLRQQSPCLRGTLTRLKEKGRFAFGLMGESGKSIEFDANYVLYIYECGDITRLIYRNPITKGFASPG